MYEDEAKATYEHSDSFSRRVIAELKSHDHLCQKRLEALPLVPAWRMSMPEALEKQDLQSSRVKQ